MGEYQIGDHVLLSRNRTGIIRFVGETQFSKGTWYGLELDLGYTGKHDGSVGGERYFTCPPCQGLFLKNSNIRSIAPDTLKLKQKIITNSTSLRRNDHVTLHDGRTGKVQYIGRVKFLKGQWYGLRLDPGHAGKNDGSFRGYRYFKCPKGQGLFVTRKRVKSKLSSPRNRSRTARSRKDLEKKESEKPQTAEPEEPDSAQVAKQGGEVPPSRPRNREPMRGANRIKNKRKKPTHTRTKSQSEKVKDFPLRREAFFHGKMNRHDAEEKVAKKGQWLLRQDRGRKMVVSVRKTRSQADHVEVGFDEKRKVYNYSKNGSRKKIVYREFEELVKSLGGKIPVLVEIDESEKRNPAAPNRVQASTKSRRRPETPRSGSIVFDLDIEVADLDIEVASKDELVPPKAVERENSIKGDEFTKKRLDSLHPSDKDILVHQDTPRPVFDDEGEEETQDTPRPVSDYEGEEETQKGEAAPESDSEAGEVEEANQKEPVQSPEEPRVLPRIVSNVVSKVTADENVDPDQSSNEDKESRTKSSATPSKVETKPKKQEMKVSKKEKEMEMEKEKPVEKQESKQEMEQSDRKDPEEDEGSFHGSISAIFGDDEDENEAGDVEKIVVSELKVEAVEQPAEANKKKSHPPPLVLDDDSNDDFSETDPKENEEQQSDPTDSEFSDSDIPRKRSADLSAEALQSEKPSPKESSGRRTPESRRSDSAKIPTLPPPMQEVVPAWFSKLSQKEQTEVVSYFTNCVQRLTNGGTVVTDAVYDAMEEKFSLSQKRVRELHMFLIGEPLPQGTSDREAEDVLGSACGTKEDQTSLWMEEFASVEEVFSTLALDDQGIETVSFRTLVHHFEVPISDEEIDALFSSIDQDDEGYVTWGRMVRFLQTENKKNQEVENNRLLLIASIKNPNHESESPPTPQADSEEVSVNTNELPDVARVWLEGAKKSLNETKPTSTKPVLDIPPKQVPGGYTKSDLLEDHEDLFELQANEAKDVLVQKLRLCCVECDFLLDTAVEKLYRKKKQELLLNISQYVSETKKWFSEDVLIAMKDLVMYNIFRSLPYKPPEVLHDPDDEPKLDLAWEHLHSCYEILLRLVIAPFTKDKLVRKYLGNEFLQTLVNMFMSEDPRERDYLKVILHRFYGKFLKPRPHIRRTMHEMLYAFIHDFPFLPGVCEILEILGSIINGFSIPLKGEHKDFLRNVLIPLHKAPVLMDFSAQLNYCITQFVAKDPALTPEILSGLLRYWPIQSSQKEVLFLTEMEAILEIVEHDSLDPVVELVFHRLGQCMCSGHFQVAEQALNLTANETISYYITRQRQRIVPIVYPYLQKNLRSHWHDTVRSVTVNILATLREMDGTLYKKIVLATKQKRKAQEAAAEAREDDWAKLIRLHS